VSGIEEGKSGVRRMDGWEAYGGLRSLVAAPAELTGEKRIPRKSRRSMGRMSILAVQAAEQALGAAGIEGDLLSSGRIGCIIGSTMGGAEALAKTFEAMVPTKDLALLPAMRFFQCVSHTAAMNVSQYLGIRGCVFATSGACASALLAVGAAYDLVRLGRQDAVICGGCEEVHPAVTGAFDILYATSAGHNDNPLATPRPFDQSRDGLVCGEGCGLIVLEEFEQARERGAEIQAEIIGFNTCGSASHVTQSNQESMVRCLRAALFDAGVGPKDVDYINAHATGTKQGDAEEAQAIATVFGEDVPVSSLKGYLGHTLAASGTLELIVALSSMKSGVLYPTRNLEEVGEDCQGISHLREPMQLDVNVIAKNCFAFGGINASLLCRRI